MEGATTTGTTAAEPDALQAEIASRGLWYHTLELAPGVETPGWFDLRPILNRLPFPDVAGKRCLDVGPYDGFLSFELERRGAREVVAADISGPEEWDWAPAPRKDQIEVMTQMAGSEPGGGFDIARRALGSSVRRVEVNAYDLSPQTVGEFDVVVCGSLLLHLRDPVGALAAIRSVCTGQFLSAEQINPELTMMGRGRPLAQLRGGDRVQWWIPNVAAHRRLLAAAGFEVEASSKPYAIPLGKGHPQHGRRLGSLAYRAATRVVTGMQGVPHVAVRARAT